MMKSSFALVIAAVLSTTAFAATNVAPLGTASQNSTGFDGPSYNGSGPASRAIDGNTNGFYWDGSVTHSGGEVGNWWSVAWNQDYAMESINVFNRTDCCSERINGFAVSVLNNGIEVWNSGEIASFTPTITSGLHESGMSFSFGGLVVGDQVKIAKTNNNWLHLAEVQVMAVPEPESYAMLLAGLGLIAGIARTRKNSSI